MSKQHGKRAKPTAKPGTWLWTGIALIAAGAVIGIVLAQKGSNTRAAASSNSVSLASAGPMASIPTNEVAQSLVVTVELDFGGPPPSIKEALTQIDRKYEPADGTGRTFAILDGYGEPTSDGKQLHLSMHLSLEKPGIGSLVFRPTGKELWKSRIVAAKGAVRTDKNLTIIIDDNAGHSALLDGSKGATRVLDVPLDGSTNRVRDVWPDGAEREFTYIYSVCGCPVKTKVRRMGETTRRSSESPVMFPDDPSVMVVIQGLMGWPPDAR